MTEPIYTPLTVADLVRPHLVGIRRVIDFGHDGRDLAADLDLAAGTAVERHDPAETEPGGLTPDDLLVYTVEPDLGADPDPAILLGVMRSLGRAGTFVLLFNGPSPEISVDATSEALALSQCRVLAAAPVADAKTRLVVIGRQSDAPGNELRVVNRALLGRLAARTHLGTILEEPAEPATEREIRGLRREITANQDRIAALEASASYRIGKAAVGAMRQPRKIGRLVPRVRLLWSRRTNPRPVRRPAPGRSAAQAARAWQEALGLAPERLFLAHSAGAAGPRTGLVIGAIVRDETAAALALDASVHRLLPNNALMTLERADPDFVLVETGAFGAGLPWAYVGSAAAVDRDRILAAVLQVAGRLGRPSVLWHSPAVPDPVGIQPFKRRFDLVVGDPGQPADLAGWHPGVQLATFNSDQLEPGRAGPALFVGTWDPRAALADRRMLERLLAAAANPGPGIDRLRGLEIRVDSRAISGAEGFPAALRPSVAGPVDLGATAGLYRSRPLLIADALAGADGRRRTLEALACGCRVVSLPDSVLAAAAGESVRFVTATDDLAMVLADTDGAGALDEAGIRPVSRRIFQGHAVPVALATLVGSLGLSVDPRARRSISLLVRVVPDDPDRLIRSMKAQAFRPNEVVIAAAAGVPVRPEVVDALTRLAITTRTVSNDAGSWPALAAAASSAWLIAWPEAGFDDPNALLDLALAAEASRADAVGFVDGAVGFVGSAADHASGSFVADLPFAGTLLRPDLAAQVRAGEPLASAARRGARLFGTQAVPDRSDR